MSNPVLTFAAGELVIIVLMVAVFTFVTGPDPASRVLYFGAAILATLALIFALGMAMSFWAESQNEARAQKIFDACVTVIPPLVTLILGYYFGQHKP